MIEFYLKTIDGSEFDEQSYSIISKTAKRVNNDIFYITSTEDDIYDVRIYFVNKKSIMFEVNHFNDSYFVKSMNIINDISSINKVKFVDDDDEYVPWLPDFLLGKINIL